MKINLYFIFIEINVDFLPPRRRRRVPRIHSRSRRLRNALNVFF